MVEGESRAAESSEGTGGTGWRNEHVRAGFDVDGAESRVHPLGMDRRIRMAQAQYAVWRGSLGDGRVFYPVIRWLGGLLGREEAAEQWIAEMEYVIDHGDAIDRRGPGTRLWWLGIATFGVVWVAMFAVGIAVAAGLLVGVPNILSSTLGVSLGDARFWVALLLVLAGSAGLGWLLIRTARISED